MNQEEFVVFPIIYGNKNPFAQGRIFSPIVIDSFMYYNAYYKDVADSTMYQKAKEYKAVPYDALMSEIKELTLVQKTDFFAEKAWDFDIDDEIPESIEVRTREGAYGNVSQYRKAINSATYFRLYAILSDQYKALDLRPKKEEVEMEAAN